MTHTQTQNDSRKSRANGIRVPVLVNVLYAPRERARRAQLHATDIYTGDVANRSIPKNGWLAHSRYICSVLSVCMCVCECIGPIGVGACVRWYCIEAESMCATATPILPNDQTLHSDSDSSTVFIL